jgi:hypothetical protein
MPHIHEGVLNGVLRDRPDLTPLIGGLLSDFDVTWASAARLYGSDVTYFMLQPKKHVREAFGFDKELCLMYMQYSTIQARVFHIANHIMSESPMQGRVEPLVCLLVSTAAGPEEQIKKLMSDKSQTRIIIPFSDSEIRANTDSYLLRNRISKYMFSRDLFDMSNPIDSDLYFFGRHDFIMHLRDSIKSGENIGLFGLRKIGKTSILLRLKRVLEEEKSGRLVRIDLESQEYYQMRWWTLLEKIASALRIRTGDTWTEDNAAERFRLGAEKLKTAGGRSQFVVALDEIEHICPGERLRMRSHWDRDFVEFWKTMRATQNANRHLSFIVCGVNAAPLETPSYNGYDNPLFSLASRRYVPPFKTDEVRQMVRTLGRFMGMHFDEDSYGYLTEAYGGHPLIVRQACSAIFKQHLSEARPISCTATTLRAAEIARNVVLFPYLDHILGVLRQWYPDELDLLKRLAEGDTKTFEEFEAAVPDSVAHLRAYGLVFGTPPRIAMRFVGDYFVRQRIVRVPEASPEFSRQNENAAQKWIQICLYRNRIEPKLRQIIKMTFQSSAGPVRWIDPIVSSLPETRRKQMVGVDRSEILNTHLYLLDLLQIIQKNWEQFRHFETMQGNLRMTKGQLEVLLDFLNRHREDAHAKNITDTDWAAYLAVTAVLERVVEAYD